MIKLLKHLSAYKWMIVGIFALIFIQSMSTLYLPTLMSDIIDKGVVVGDIPYIWKIGGFMLVVSALGTVASVIASYYSSKAAIGLGGMSAGSFSIILRNFPFRNSMKWALLL